MVPSLRRSSNSLTTFILGSWFWYKLTAVLILVRLYSFSTDLRPRPPTFLGRYRDAIKLRYDWEITDIPAICTRGDLFTVDHAYAMVCKRGGLIIQRHNEIRNLEAEMLRMVCTDVKTEPVLQEIVQLGKS